MTDPRAHASIAIRCAANHDFLWLYLPHQFCTDDPRACFAVACAINDGCGSFAGLTAEGLQLARFLRNLRMQQQLWEVSIRSDYFCAGVHGETCWWQMLPRLVCQIRQIFHAPALPVSHVAPLGIGVYDWHAPMLTELFGPLAPN